MKQLVRTSWGWLELDLERLPGGGDVTVSGAVFHDEGGWATAERVWNKWSAESLEAFLSEIADIPPEEAAQVAQRALDGWRARGGEVEDRGEKRKVVAWVTSVFGLAAFGALTALALAVILLAKLI